jgi:uncharacterized protein YicC (UPF0701 family)
VAIFFLLPRALGMTAVFDKVLGHSCRLPDLLCQFTDEIKKFGPKSTKRGTLNFFFQPQKVKHRGKNSNILSVNIFLWVSSQKKKETNHKKILGSRRGCWGSHAWDCKPTC